MVSFNAAVAAIADALSRQREAEPPASESDIAAVTEFLLGVHKTMPLLIRLPIGMLTVAFDFWGFFTGGQPFHKLSLEKRLSQVRHWNQSRFETRRRLIEFYNALTVFGLYSELYDEEFHIARAREEALHNA